MAKRNNVGDLYVGDRVIYDDKLFEVVKFPSRRNVKINGLYNSEGVIEVSLRDVEKQPLEKTVAVMDKEIHNES